MTLEQIILKQSLTSAGTQEFGTCITNIEIYGGTLTPPPPPIFQTNNLVKILELGRGVLLEIFK